MRIIGIALFSAVVASASAAGTPWHPMDLNRPGALEQLRRERPTHYLAVSEILRIAEQGPCKPREVETLKARFDVRDMECNFLLMTSEPPKRRLNFTLEGVSYMAVVTLKDQVGMVVPATHDGPSAR